MRQTLQHRNHTCAEVTLSKRDMHMHTQCSAHLELRSGRGLLITRRCHGALALLQFLAHLAPLRILRREACLPRNLCPALIRCGCQRLPLADGGSRLPASVRERVRHSTVATSRWTRTHNKLVSWQTIREKQHGLDTQYCDAGSNDGPSGDTTLKRRIQVALLQVVQGSAGLLVSEQLVRLLDSHICRLPLLALVRVLVGVQPQCECTICLRRRRAPLP